MQMRSPVATNNTCALAPNRSLDTDALELCFFARTTWTYALIEVAVGIAANAPVAVLLRLTVGAALHNNQLSNPNLKAWISRSHLR